jgi:hypothetical protein
MRETDLAVFRIPNHVEKIDGSAFGRTTTTTVTVDEANANFRVAGDFLLDAAGRTLIRYFGRESPCVSMTPLRCSPPAVSSPIRFFCAAISQPEVDSGQSWKGRSGTRS